MSAPSSVFKVFLKKISPLMTALLPIIIVLALFGGLIVLTQGSAVAPFIYTIF